jgi:hypothetical protein
MDLLTVLAHEVGHLLDRQHDDEALSVMAELLAAGTRRTIGGEGGTNGLELESSAPVAGDYGQAADAFFAKLAEEESPRARKLADFAQR